MYWDSTLVEVSTTGSNSYLKVHRQLTRLVLSMCFYHRDRRAFSVVRPAYSFLSIDMDGTTILVVCFTRNASK